MTPADLLHDIAHLADKLGEIQAEVSKVQFGYSIKVESIDGDPIGWLVDEIGEGSWFFTTDDPTDRGGK